MSYKKFSDLSAPYEFKEYYSKYPHGYSIFEAILDWLQHVNDMTGVLNQISTDVSEFYEQVNANIMEYATETIQAWMDEGVFEQIIGDVVDTILLNLTEHLNTDYIHRRVFFDDDPIPTEYQNDDIVVTPKIYKGCLLSKSIVQNIPFDVTTTVIWQTQQYDVGGFFDESNPTRLTVPAGVKKVRLSANVGWAVTGIAGDITARMQYFIMKNGSGYAGMPYIRIDGVNPYVRLPVSSPCVVNVNAGDYFELTVRQGKFADPTGLDVNPQYTWFYIEVVE